MAMLIPAIPYVASALAAIFAGGWLGKAKENAKIEEMRKKEKQENEEKVQLIEKNLKEEQIRNSNFSTIYEEREMHNRRLETEMKASKKQIRSLEEQLSKLQELLNQVMIQLAEEKLKAKEKNDPLYFKKAKEGIFVAFLDNLKTFKFTEAIQKDPNRRYHMVMGLISAGKSSLLRKITGIKLKVGQGECSLEAARVCEYQYDNKTVEVFDSPGINESFSCYDIETLALLHGMDEIFVVYRDSLKNVAELIQIIHAIKPDQKIKLVRTHCDCFTEDDDKTCEEEIEVDYKYMKGLNIECEIFAFSSKKDMNFKDNSKVAALMKGEEISLI